MNPRACVVITNPNDQVLLIKIVKNGCTYWVFPGGSVESGETVREAAIREAYEELSLKVSLGEILLEQRNSGRHETYFSVTNFTGVVELGDGPEQNRVSPENQYEPMWVELSKVSSLNNQPTTTGGFISTFFLGGSR